MVKLGHWLAISGILLDLLGAVIVLASDWAGLYNRLVRLGEKESWIAAVPIVGIPLRRLEFLYRLEQAEETLLSGEFDEVNRTKENPPLSSSDDGFEALKTVLVEELDVLPQFNRVSLGLISRGHTNQPDVSRTYLNTSILTVMRGRVRNGIEPAYLRDYIDSRPLEEVQRVVETKKNGIIVGIGARLLILGFSLQLTAKLVGP